MASAGYDPEAITHFIYHWAPGRDIAIYVDASNPPADADLPAAVQAAITEWEAVGRLGEIRMHAVGDIHDADVIVHFNTTPRRAVAPADPENPETNVCAEPPDVGSGSTWICVLDDLRAITLELTDGSGGHVKMDVSVSRAAVPDQAAFRSVVMHELGHVLGIGAHSPDAADLMFVRPRAPTPTDADARTLRFVLSQRADVPF